MFSLRSATSHLNDSLKSMRHAMYVSPVESYHQSINQIQEAIKPPVFEISKHALATIPDIAIPHIPTVADFMSPTPSEIVANLLPVLKVSNLPRVSNTVFSSIANIPTVANFMSPTPSEIVANLLPVLKVTNLPRVSNTVVSSMIEGTYSPLNQLTSAIRLDATLRLPSIRNLFAEVMLTSKIPLSVFDKVSRAVSANPDSENHRHTALDEFFSSFEREYDTVLPSELHDELEGICSGNVTQKVAEALMVKISCSTDEKIVMYLVLLLTAIQTAISIISLASGE